MEKPSVEKSKVLNKNIAQKILYSHGKAALGKDKVEGFSPREVRLAGARSLVPRLLLAGAVTAGSLAYAIGSGEKSEPKRAVYEVKEGDTNWRIVRRFTAPGSNRQDDVHQLNVQTGNEPFIQPGQKLILEGEMAENYLKQQAEMEHQVASVSDQPPK